MIPVNSIEDLNRGKESIANNRYKTDGNMYTITKHEWKWSKQNVPYAERTPRQRPQHHQQQHPQSTHEYGTEQYKSQYGPNKRDQTAERMAERQHIPQISRNPFLEILNQCEGDKSDDTTHQQHQPHISMYIQDLTIQDQYLRPQDSNTASKQNT